MQLFLICFLVFVLVILLMAVGVIFKKQAISGTCGGLNNFEKDNDGNCQVCGASVNKKCRKKIMEK